MAELRPERRRAARDAQLTRLEHANEDPREARLEDALVACDAPPDDIEARGGGPDRARHGPMVALAPGDPSHLGPYRILGRLGEGSQGVVYLAESPDGSKVAIKLLRPDLVGDASARTRFLREVAAAKRVARFCTAQVLAADAEGERPYIVSEYVAGPSLHDLVHLEGPRDGAALERLAIGTASALAGIHKAGVVHRDFKPDNVLIGADGPRVIDFGVARALDTAATGLTSSAVGTPAYMAPEQLAGTTVGPPADIFAWAVTMVYAATGHPAFGNDTIPAVMHRVLHEQPDVTPLQQPLRDVVRACLAKDPAHRPTTQRILLTLVGQEDPPAAEMTATDLPRRRRLLPVVAGAAAVAGVAAIAVTAAAVIFSRDDKPVADAAPRAPHGTVSAQPKRGRACATRKPVYKGKLHGQYCEVRGHDITVYANPNGRSPIVGRLGQGGTANWFVGQTNGAPFRQGALRNSHWAYTLADGTPRRWGWVPIVYFRDGGTGLADATLAACGPRCHPY